MDIHRSLISEFMMPSVKKVFIVDYYEGINSLLQSRLGVDMGSFLARPRSRTQSEIIWSTNLFTEKPTLLKDLSSPLKEQYTIGLKNRIVATERLIEDLKDETDGMSTANMLSKVISYIDDNSVYCSNGKIVVVNWGMIPRLPVSSSGGLYRSGHFFGNWETIGDNAPQSEQEPITPQSPTPTPGFGESEVLSNLSDDHPTEPFQNDLPTEASDQDVIQQSTDQVELVHPLQPTTQTIPTDPTQKLLDPGRPEEPEKPVAPEKPQEPSSDTFTPPIKPHPPVEQDTTWHSFFKGLGRGIVFLLKKLWWFLLLIVILLLIMLLTKGYQGKISKINPFYDPMPKESQILPLEDNCVGLSSDGFSIIALERLNVLFDEGVTYDEMHRWCKEFKRLYPEKDYFIYYYNLDLGNLQIKIPASERDNIKESLPAQMRQFRFNVYEESVSKTYSPYLNDPALSNADYSWYLDAIGARKAWDICIGKKEIVVAIVDNGFDLAHPEFTYNVVAPYNAYEGTTNIYPIHHNGEIDGHGTHVAATAIGDCNNKNGLLGIAPLCSFMPVQVGGKNTEHIPTMAEMDGVMYAVNHGAHVVNISIGSIFSERELAMSENEQLNYIKNSHKEEEELWNRIYAKAKKNKCIIVRSAGNENILSGMGPECRSDYPIIVSAVSTDKTKASFSNYGHFPRKGFDYSNISAPGVDIYNALPNNNYGFLSGTSMASPIVTGAVALIKSLDPDLSASEVRHLLQETGIVVDERIGPLIQIDAALKIAINGYEDANDCEAIKRHIAMLQHTIDSLSQLCNEVSTPDEPDTLKYDDILNDPSALNGLWKSTTQLHSSVDNRPLDLYMEFSDLKGSIIIIQDSFEYRAPLEASVSDNKLHIIQKDDAKNPKSNTFFYKYKYICTPDRDGNLKCIGTCQSSKLEFYLVKVK